MCLLLNLLCPELWAGHFFVIWRLVFPAGTVHFWMCYSTEGDRVRLTGNCNPRIQPSRGELLQTKKLGPFCSPLGIQNFWGFCLRCVNTASGWYYRWSLAANVEGTAYVLKLFLLQEHGTFCFVLVVLCSKYGMYFSLLENKYRLPPGNNQHEADEVYGDVHSYKNGSKRLLKNIRSFWFYPRQ